MASGPEPNVTKVMVPAGAHQASAGIDEVQAGCHLVGWAVTNDQCGSEGIRFKRGPEHLFGQAGQYPVRVLLLANA